ncbi:hypothetical protein [Sphingobacterium siyangense]|jgi:hypothetical protein|uniref:hypothetical protein n=1 Tax=Sphingobacterium siyangense TaxID=459529 RepID=UPI0028AD5EA9|nr:hypothetical protein [Sphingobacterium siyangense]
MENRIILDNTQVQPEATDQVNDKHQPVKPNLFQGRTDAELENAKFPNWDIVPPNQFINPRIKKHS